MMDDQLNGGVGCHSLGVVSVQDLMNAVYGCCIAKAGPASAMAAKGDPCGEQEKRACTCSKVAAVLLQHLGQSGLGVIGIGGFNDADAGGQLLPWARRLSAMPIADMKAALKANSMGTDVALSNPSRPVSSFSRNVALVHSDEEALGVLNAGMPEVSSTRNFWKADADEVGGEEVAAKVVLEGRSKGKAASSGDGEGGTYESDGLRSGTGEAMTLLCDSEGGVLKLREELESTSKRMAAVALLIARLCDWALEISEDKGLEAAMKAGGMAKARMIHYHSYAEQKRGITTKSPALHSGGPAKTRSKPRDRAPVEPRAGNLDSEEPDRSPAYPAQETDFKRDGGSGTGTMSGGKQSDWLGLGGEPWQQWHYDYALFTLLAGPKYQQAFSGRQAAPAAAAAGVGLISEWGLADSATGCHKQELADSATGCHKREFADSATGCHKQECADSATGCHKGEIADSATGCHKREFADSATGYHKRELPEDCFREVSQKAAREHSGLCVLDPATGQASAVAIPPGVFCLQVGEAAQILSGGQLRATAHCVLRPPKEEAWDRVCREMFVMFVQPGWNWKLSPPHGYDAVDVLGEEMREESQVLEDSGIVQRHLHKPEAVSGHKEADGASETCSQEVGTMASDTLKRVIPSLSLRWELGMSFGDFAKKTIMSYYGAGGVQKPNGLKQCVQ